MYGTIAPVNTIVLPSRPPSAARPCRLHQRIGSVRDHDRVLLGGTTPLHDPSPALFVHVQAIDHCHGFDGEVEPGAPQPQHFRDVRIAKEQAAREFVVVLVEGAAGHQVPDSHASGRLTILQLERRIRAASVDRPKGSATIRPHNPLARHHLAMV